MDAENLAVADDRPRYPNISPTAWEHPADRAALAALRRIPMFDTLLRKLVGMFGEKSIRLTFKANAVKVTEAQYGWLHEQLLRVCETLDLDDVPDLYVSQTPLANAGAIGLDKPFIVLNSSLVEILDREQCEAVLAHEVGHIMSGHAVYRTMLMLLLRFALTRYPVAGVAIRPILYALLEWSRKAELSCDRAAVLATHEPEHMLGALMRMAGGSRGEDLDLDEFIAQAQEYRDDGDTLAGVYKLLAALGTTHPFAVVRVAELQDWVDSGAPRRMQLGDYRTREEDAATPLSTDLGDAGGQYARSARKIWDGVGDRVSDVTSRIAQGWNDAQSGAGSGGRDDSGDGPWEQDESSWGEDGWGEGR